MNISIELFASLKQKSGWARRSMQVPAETTVGELLDRLDREFPELRVRKVPLYVAVNEVFAKADHKLQEEDKVAFFPPVSGGAA